MDRNLRQRGWSINSSGDDHSRRDRAESMATHQSEMTEQSMSEAEKLTLLNSAFDHVGDDDEHHRHHPPPRKQDGNNKDDHGDGEVEEGEEDEMLFSSEKLNQDDYAAMFGEDDDDGSSSSSDGGGSSGHHPFFPLGTKVVKTFGDAGKMITFKGEIKSYDVKEKLYLIEYEDEDLEELTKEEVSNILVTRRQSLNDDDIATNASQAGDSRELVNSGVQTLRRPRIDEAGSKRKVAAAMPPAKRKQGQSRSDKQKNIPRQNIADDMFRIAPSLIKDLWNVKQSSFKSNELLPLDCVEFDKEKNRYQVTSAADFTEDDVILQAMVVFALYRMEKGWGQKRSIKALSIWGGKPANDTDDELFPLANLWKEEIRQRVSEKVIGPTTLNHVDNFDGFPRFYIFPSYIYLPEIHRSRWSRRSDSYIGQVHIFAEQAAIQLALHLHEHVSRDYAILSNLIIFTALRDDEEDMTWRSSANARQNVPAMPERTAEKELALYLNSLIDSSRKETDCFPKTAVNDISTL